MVNTSSSKHKAAASKAKTAAKKSKRTKTTVEKPSKEDMVNEFTLQDVITGRGNHLAKLPGNVRFRQILHAFRAPYQNTVNGDKKLWSKLAMEKVVEGGGRFLQIHSWDGVGTKGLFSIVPSDRAVEKIAQSLRELKWTEPAGSYALCPETLELVRPSESERSNKKSSNKSRATVVPPSTDKKARPLQERSSQMSELVGVLLPTMHRVLPDAKQGKVSSSKPLQERSTSSRGPRNQAKKRAVSPVEETQPVVKKRRGSTSSASSTQSSEPVRTQQATTNYKGKSSKKKQGFGLKIGESIEVYFPLDGVYYEAEILGRRHIDGFLEFLIRYVFDQAEEWIDLTEHRWAVKKMSQPTTNSTVEEPEVENHTTQQKEENRTQSVLIMKEGKTKLRKGRRNLFAGLFEELAAKVSSDDGEHSDEDSKATSSSVVF